jgi:hypothetical protein
VRLRLINFSAASKFYCKIAKSRPKNLEAPYMIGLTLTEMKQTEKVSGGIGYNWRLFAGM